MGQRHQLYLIAKICGRRNTPPKYESIGSWHHQALYGTGPLQAVRHITTALSNPVNARVVENELKSMAGLFDTPEDERPEVPAPFLTNLLTSVFGMNTILDSFYNQNPYHDVKSDDNNDGITVVDVTAPQNPRHCFVNIYRLDAAVMVTPRDTPLSAETYARAYDPEGDPETDDVTEEEVKTLIEDLAGFSLITPITLAETWRYDFKKPPATATSKPVEGEAIPKGLSPLQTMAAKRFIEDVCANNHAGPESLFVLEGPAIDIELGLQLLIKQSSLSDSAIQVMAALLTRQFNQIPGNDTLDLRPYNNLTSDQFISLAQALSPLPIRTVDLSHNPNIVSEALQGLERSFPGMQRLVLIGCTGISGTDIVQLRNEGSLRNVEAIWHTELLSSSIDIKTQPLRSEPKFIFALHYSEPSKFPANRKAGSVAISLPHVMPRTIIPGIIDFIAAVKDLTSYGGSQSLDIARCAFAGLEREFGMPVESRAVGVLLESRPPPKSLATPCWYFVLDFTTKTGYGPDAGPATIVGGFTYAFPNVDDASELEILDVDQFLGRLGSDEKQAIDPRWVDALKSNLPRSIDPAAANKILKKVA